tara:strand:- start:724 stop:1887 length:1164 start_codon:yes stop_codon:yes gene_type:complete
MTKYKKKIFFLTGKRGGFDAMTPLLKLLSKDKKIQLKIIATDQHLLKKFGSTINSVNKIFSKETIQLNLYQKNSMSYSRLISMSKLVAKLSSYLLNNKPDLMIIYGDRAEAFIAAFVCNHLNIKICHFQGGDLTGNIDERFRHAISKMSDYHFVSNQLAKKRLIQLGEDKNSIFNHGDNHIDSLKKVRFENIKFLTKKNGINIDKEYVVLLFHPDGTSFKKNKIFIKEILISLKKMGIQVHCIYPCTDIGYEEIIDQLEKISKINKLFNVYKNLNYSLFINLVKNSKFLIGNSSSGIIESSYLNVPVINLGDRQKNRMSCSNVINCKINNRQIDNAIKYILSGKLKKKIKRTKPIYGNGESYLKNFKVIRKLLNQKSTYYNKIFNEL